jgi:phospholipase C
MTAIGRRTVLSMMAGGAVLAANRTVRSDSPVEGSDPRIRHIVVLMLENRSFDHMLGLLAPEVPGLRGVSLGEYSNVGIDGVRYDLTDGARYQG